MHCLETSHVFLAQRVECSIGKNPRSGVHAHTADDDHIVRFAILLNLHRPRGAATRMTGSEVRDQGHAAEFHFLSIPLGVRMLCRPGMSSARANAFAPVISAIMASAS